MQSTSFPRSLPMTSTPNPHSTRWIKDAVMEQLKCIENTIYFLDSLLADQHGPFSGEIRSSVASNAAAELEMLERRMAIACKKLRGFQLEIKRRRTVMLNAIAPISKLPVEALRAIFRELVLPARCCQESHPLDGDTIHALSMTCYQWRELVMGYPYLWTHIQLDWSPVRIQRWIGRARGLPLHIHNKEQAITHSLRRRPSSLYKILFSIIYQMNSEWESFRIYNGTQFQPEELSQLYSSTKLVVGEIIFCTVNPQNFIGRRGSATRFSLTSRPVFLRDLTIRSAALSVIGSPPNLEKLTLTDCEVPTATWYDALSSMRHLRLLSVARSYQREAGINLARLITQIKLPALEVLQLNDPNREFVELVVSFCDLPKLHTISLTKMTPFMYLVVQLVSYIHAFSASVALDTNFLLRSLNALQLRPFVSILVLMIEPA